MRPGGSILRQGKRNQSWLRSDSVRIRAGLWARRSSSTLWKSRWSGICPLRRVVDQPNCARTQDNQILISAYHEILSWTYIHSRLRLVNFPSVPKFPPSFLTSPTPNEAEQQVRCPDGYARSTFSLMRVPNDLGVDQRIVRVEKLCLRLDRRRGNVGRNPTSR